MFAIATSRVKRMSATAPRSRSSVNGRASAERPVGRDFLLCLAVLTFVCLLAQCRPNGRALQVPPPTQALESVQTPTPMSEEELELFNALLNRA